MLPPDATLDEIRTALAARVAANAAFDGWGEAAVTTAAQMEGVDSGIALLAFPGGAIDQVDAWFESIDARMITVPLAGLKVREKIIALVEARLDALAPDRESLRRALAIMAMPQNVARAAKLGWRTVDRMWRAAGDTATDYNHYTKRLTLGAIYTATCVVLLDDDSEGHADTRAFLRRRIDELMRFEKSKAQFLAREHFSVSRFIGRLRYPAV